MSNEMQIDVALTHLEAGRFSFRMVDAIKSHIDKLERELAVAQDLHSHAIRDVKRQEYVVWRLEGELKKSNARVYALLKANRLTEAACIHAMTLGSEAKAYAETFAKMAAAFFAQAAAKLNDAKFREDSRRHSKEAVERASMRIRALADEALVRVTQVKQDWDPEAVTKTLADVQARVETLLLGQKGSLGGRLQGAKGSAARWAQKATSQLASARTRLKERSQDAA